jgi:hypothetical protein
MTTVECPVTTKRMVMGQVLVCSGCCCGAVTRGKPEVPVEWLKQEWRSRGLLKNIQLSISLRSGTMRCHQRGPHFRTGDGDLAWQDRPIRALFQSHRLGS